MIKISSILFAPRLSSVISCRFYSVRVRFAPSPTGSLHLGGFRTALLNFIFAQKHLGDFILRIEDTDQERVVTGAAKNLEEDLCWLNIVPTESPLKGGKYGPYTQSERKSLYKSEVRRLVEKGAAYPCFCSEKRMDILRRDAVRRRELSRYDGKCRELRANEVKHRIEKGEPYCIRFKHPPPPHKFVDAVYGPVTLEEVQGDFVILKSDGFPTYHLASVVDDYYMKITHVLRGVEWQVSTGKHIALNKALGFTPPVFAHLPLILNTDGSKLSKRQSDISIDYYRSKQYYPEALINFVIGNRNRIDSIEEIVSKFELQSHSKSSNKLDFAYLEDLNRLCLKKAWATSLDALREWLPGESEEFYKKVLSWCPQRVTKLSDLPHQFPFLAKNFTPPKCDEDESQIITVVLERLEKSTGEVKHDDFKQISSSNKIPIKTLMQILRKTLCGFEVGPPVYEVVNLLGKEESVRRLKLCLANL